MALYDSSMPSFGSKIGNGVSESLETSSNVNSTWSEFKKGSTA